MPGISNRTGLIVVIACVLLVGAAAYLYVRQTLAFAPLPTYNTSVLSGRPEGAACINRSPSAELAIELIDLGEDRVYLAGGSNPISEAEWDSTRVRFPHMKNSKRYLLFDETCIYRSPGKAATCAGDDCLAWVELYGHTWFVLNDLAGQGCYPDASGCSGEEVKPGYLSVTTIDKCQEITFAGPTIYDLVDERGNHYVMHATATDAPTTEGVQLPTGWTLSEVTLTEPLTLQPRGEGHCYYNILRDEKVQSYHQYIFTDDTFPSALQ